MVREVEPLRLIDYELMFFDLKVLILDFNLKSCIDKINVN